MKTSYLTLTLVLQLLCVNYVTSQESSSKVDCDAQLVTSDEAVDKMLMLVNKNVTEYKTLQAFDTQYCRPFMGWLNEARKYKPCLKAFPTQIYSIIMSNIKKTHKTYCLSEPNKNLAFRHLRCMRPSNKEGFLQVGSWITSMMNYVADVEDLDEAIPSMCCGTRNLLAKSEELLESICSKARKEGSGKWMTALTFSLVADALDLMCAGYSSIEECKNKVPEIMAKVDNATISDGNYNYTAITPLIKLIRRLDGQITLQ